MASRWERGSGTRWFDSLDVSPVVEFFERVLVEYDTSLLETVKLRALPRNRWLFACERPVRERAGSRRFERGYRLRGGVKVKQRFPVAETVHVGWDRTDSADDPIKLIRRVTFSNIEEVTAFALGAAMFRFLRHAKQVPGRDIRSQARRHGLYSVAVYRSGYVFDPFNEHGRLVARDALEESGDAEGLALLAPYP